MIKKALLDKIFFEKDSKEGLAKQKALAGELNFGRLCTAHIEGRNYPYRFTKEDFSNYNDKVKEFVQHCPIGIDAETYNEFCKKLEQDGFKNTIETMMDIFQSLIDSEFSGAFKRLMPDGVWETVAKEIVGYSVEIFLIQPKKPCFVFEFFPAFKGDNLDSHYGSKLKSIFPIQGITQNQAAYLEKAGWAVFFQTVFLEKMYELISKSKEIDFEQLFKQNAEKWIADEWIKEKGLWFLRSSDAVFGFISKFANELAMHNGIQGEVVGAYSEQQLAFTVKNVPLNAALLN